MPRPRERGRSRRAWTGSPRPLSPPCNGVVTACRGGGLRSRRMRSSILVVAGSVEARARLARRLTGAGYAVELAESARHARRLGADRAFSLAVVEPVGLGAGTAELVDELRATVG